MENSPGNDDANPGMEENNALDDNVVVELTPDCHDNMHGDENNPVEIITICEDVTSPKITDDEDQMRLNCEKEDETTLEKEDQSPLIKSNVRLDFAGIPLQITGAWTAFEHKTNNYTKGCKWAPDGSCILTCSEDAKLRLFNLPMNLWQSPINWEDMCELCPVLCASEPELIYDYCWYPVMSSLDPVTCCFVSSCRSNPIHMWDAFTGEMRCTYRPYNQVDEIVTAHSLAFSMGGHKLLSGFKNMIRIFDVSVPGRDCLEMPTFIKKDGQKGIVSCFALSAENRSLFAAGSYEKTVGLYSESDGTLIHLLEEHRGGITHMCFSPDGYHLYSGARKDPEILCWDLRNLEKPLFRLRRGCDTNQRIYFDISRCGQYVTSGNQNGVVTVWDVKNPESEVHIGQNVILEPIQFYQAHNDCVNCVGFHPNLPLMASSSGERKFPDIKDSEDEEDNLLFTNKNITRDNSLRLWWIGGLT